MNDGLEPHVSSPGSEKLATAPKPFLGFVLRESARKRLTRIAAFLGVLALLTQQLSPYWQVSDSDYSASSFDEKPLKDAEDKFQQRLLTERPKDPQKITVAIPGSSSFLVRVLHQYRLVGTVTVDPKSATPADVAMTTQRIEDLPSLRVDNLILFILGAILFLLAVWYSTNPEASAFGTEAIRDTKKKKAVDQSVESQLLSDLSAIDRQFVRVSQTIREDANRQFFQARMMLVAGILVAIAGVAIFATILDVSWVRYQDRSSYEGDYFGRFIADLVDRATRGDLDTARLEKILTYAEKNAEIQAQRKHLSFEDTIPFLLPSMRSFALFLALEAIAWFLLRQYRFAIGDFKQLFRLYVRREVNFLAFKLVQSNPSTAATLLTGVIGAMMQEDLATKLHKDETTEGLEEAKLIEENPVTSLWKAILDKIPTKAQ